MFRRTWLAWAATMTVGLALLPLNAQAQQKSLQGRLAGAWTLVSVYDQHVADGKKTETWGPGVQGTIMLSPGGRFSYQIVAANREKGNKTPRDPVGYAIGYFGTYTVDEAAKTFTLHIERATFPQWDGTDRITTVASLSDTELSLETAPVHDPVMGDIVPHSQWKRAN